MISVPCPAPGCTYVAESDDAGIVTALLNIHVLEHSRSPIPTSSGSSGPKLNRPSIEAGIDEESWNAFIRRWETFRVGSGISTTAATAQFFQCTSDSLGDLILKADANVISKSLSEIIDLTKSLAVIPIARGVKRAELLQMRQGDDEPIRTFAARVRGKAEICGFTTSITCKCGETCQANYTEEVIRDVLLSGIADIDIRREALSSEEVKGKTVNQIISVIESKEMARNATPTPGAVAAMSSYKKARSTSRQGAAAEPTTPCPECQKPFQRFRERPNGELNKQPYRMCLSCFKSKKKQKTPEVRAIDCGDDASDSDIVYQVGTINGSQRHPTIAFRVGNNNLKNPRMVEVRAVADTGAMSNVWSKKDFLKAGFSINELQPTSTNFKIRAVNGQNMDIIGTFCARFEGKTLHNEIVHCIDNIFITDSVNDFFLSNNTMKLLYIVDENFPTIGHCKPKTNNVDENDECELYTGKINEIYLDLRSLSSGCSNPNGENVPCACPIRTPVPSRPNALPFPAIPENIDRMRGWLVDRFASSTFNTCPHRALPCITGPPMEIHLDKLATPKVCHKPASVPLHWQQRVYEDLVRDEALGVIERVPNGVPVTWCHRMVVTRKHDGTPRRTVDLSPLNKFCIRETFPAEAPFHLARRVPGKTWKSVVDAWNGYHSIPLRESDRHLTTFITPFGRWRYTRAPQGFLSSGDGYNKRFDSILTDFQRKERCIDDTVYHDEDLETHWWRTIDLLTIMGNAGAVLNPDKFQFCEKQVDFAGFRISENTIEPLPKYIEAIRSFPTPKSIKDIRSWFGLVNQVANYGQLREFMDLFRPFLSPKYKFFWTEVLDKAFEESKECIVQAIKLGVEIYDLSKPTCLRPDWSTRGIGYFLLQKHCACPSELPDCCPNGWKVTLAGSRFLTDAEKRYAAVEGEALAIAWGLEQTRYFTQGCEKLLVVTDHKPLVKIFGDRTLDEISNTRLFRLKQRSLPWHFRTVHMPGRTNDAADATSRYPNPGTCTEVSSVTVNDHEEQLLAASISQETEDITSVSWELLAKETMEDKVLSKLITAMNEGFQGNNDGLSDYLRYRDSLYMTDGVILYQDRVVVPSRLRQTILEKLHSAHQGVSAMQSRAQAIVFWPGMSYEIQEIRTKCRDCNRNAPSQAPIPSETATPPLTPFEQIFADFFELSGHHYLVIGDRLSGWPEIFYTPSGSTSSGARGLIKCLRFHFATFGVPESLSSDGGPEFMASMTREFLNKWNVRHRVSSAYYPQSNGRAEVAVKAAKRLLRSNIGPNGSLDNDKFLAALLQARNTPDPDCNLSPAQIIFGKPLRDTMSFINKLEKFSNPNVRPVWRDAWAEKEGALRIRFAKSSEALNEHVKVLKPLKIGDKCFIQNQTGPYPKKWHRTGTVVEVSDNNQYTIKIDGSGRVTKRNRRFLRELKPAAMKVGNSLGEPMEPLFHDNSESKSKEVEIKEDQERPVQVNPPLLFEEQNHDFGEPSNDENPLAMETLPKESNVSLSRDESLQTEHTDIRSQKIPAALKRLLPHNAAGQKEHMVAPEDGGRQTRRSKNL